MKPILFAENATTFTTNGIGRLSDALDCVVSEERNGSYELEMTYPMKGVHYEEISIRKIIVAKPSANASLQAFRIYKMGKPINGKVKIYAQHITYDLSKNVCMPQSVTASSSACNTVLQGLKSNAVETCPFSFWTNVTTVASYKQAVPGSIRSRLGGVEGSVLDQFGGEYEWDNFTVKLHKNRGTERNITLRYGKNITDIEQEENIANTITGCVPYWIDYEGTTTVTLPEKAVYSSHASEYSSKLTVPLDLSAEWENAPTEAALRSAATVYMNKTGMGIPKVSVKVSFVNLADSEEYKDILPLENVNLCDVIKVQFEELGIDTTAEIVETEYDVLKEKYKSLQVGSLKSSMASTINDIEKGAATEAENTGKRVFAEANTKAQDMVNNATAWITSGDGYVVAIKGNDGEWKELLFMDTNDVDTAHNVLRINENGIGFSSRGVGGPYTQAWTLDGKLVIGGTNVPSISAIDNNGNVLFQASANGVSIDKGTITLKDGSNNIVFQASSSGITVGKGSISGASITLGGANNGDGTLTVLNNSGTTVGTWNNNGISINAGSININNKFKVSTDGDITAPSGSIGGFTLENNYIRHDNTNSTSSGAVTFAKADFNRNINGRNRTDLRLAIGSGFGVDEDGVMYASNVIVGGDGGGKIEAYNASNTKTVELSKDHIYYKNPSDGHYVELKTKSTAAIVFDNDSYIDGVGSGFDNGMKINAANLEFSVPKIDITKTRGSNTVYGGYDGTIAYGTDTENLSYVDSIWFEDGIMHWGTTTRTVIKDIKTSDVIHGLIVK